VALLTVRYEGVAIIDRIRLQPVSGPPAVAGLLAFVLSDLISEATGKP
jgi:hypothetical protein